MKLKNTCRGTIWIKGIGIKPQQIRDIPITKPEVLASELRTKVQIVKDETKSVPLSRPPKKYKPFKAFVKLDDKVEEIKD